MNQKDVEELASGFRIRAGVRADEVVPAEEIAVRAIGASNLHVVDELSTGACVSWLRGRPHIFVRSDVRDRNFAVAHECGHIAIHDAGYQCAIEEEERLANLIGAAICAPPRAVQRAYIYFGERPNRIAEAFSLSQTATVLRVAEVRGDARAVVTANQNVMERGFAGVRPSQIVRWATRPTPAMGIRKVTLTGEIDAGRVAIRKVG